MNIRNQLEKKIEANEKEIDSLKSELIRKESFLQGLREALRMLPRPDGETAAQILRPGSDMAKTREILKKAGNPMYIDDILKGLGRQITTNARASLAGSIGNYARRGEIFIKTGPNTFGLIAFKDKGVQPEDEPPDDFGLDDSSKNGKLEQSRSSAVLIEQKKGL